MSYLLLDVVVLALLALFVYLGAKKGLVRSLCGLLAVLVAFGGASLTAKALAPAVGRALEPRLTAAIEQQLDRQMEQAGGSLEGALDDLPLQDVLDLLRDMGFYEELIDTVDRAVDSGLTQAAASAAAQAAAAIAQALAFRLIFAAAFAVLLAVWAVISRSLNLVARLPGLHTLNQLGGALIGLFKGGLLLFLAGWLLSMGALIPAEVVQQTYLLQFFMTNTPLSLLGGAVI